MTATQAPAAEQPSPEYRPWVPLLIAVVALVWFWFFRTNLWTGGDSEQWEREIYGGVWWRRRQMLSFATLQAVHQVMHALDGWSAHRSINLASAAAGSISIAIGWNLLRERPHAPWCFALFATGGFSALFYGHIETYALSTTALLLHLLAVERALSGRWPTAAVPFTWVLFIGFHLVGFFATPAMAAITLWLLREQRWPRRQILLTGAAAATAGLFLYALTGLNAGGGEMVGWMLVQYWRSVLNDPAQLLTQPQNLPKLWFAIWNGGVAVLAGLWVLGRALRRRSDPQHRFPIALGAYFLCFLGFWAIWDPHMLYRDWDLFSFPWTVLTVAAAWGALQLPGRAIWAGAILGVNLLLWTQRPLLWAEIDRRDTSTLVMKGPLSTQFYVLLNDRRLLYPGENRYIRPGGHQLRLIDVEGARNDLRIFYTEGNETFYYEASPEEGLRFLRSEP